MDNKNNLKLQRWKSLDKIYFNHLPRPKKYEIKSRKFYIFRIEQTFSVYGYLHKIIRSEGKRFSFCFVLFVVKI